MTERPARGADGLVWFRRDLRLEDNPAWSAATAAHARIAALYVLDPRRLATAAIHRRRRHLAELHAFDRALAGLGPKAIHAPWEAGSLELAAAGITLGITYPNPIVDHPTARRRAIAVYERARASASEEG